MAPEPEQELDPETVRTQLEEHLERLGVRIEEHTKAPERGSGISFGKRIGDGTTEAIDRFVQVGVAERLDTVEAEVMRALTKLDEGTYGTCDVCGAEIPAGRLKARPESVLCVDCSAG